MKRFGIFLGLAVAGLNGRAGAAEKPGPVTREAALASRAEHDAAWREAMEKTRPRLYFSEAAWPEVVRQIEGMAEPRAALTRQFFAEMDQTVAEKTPAYVPPEEMAGKRGDASTLYAAREELWERQVGNRIFGLAVAARMRPEGPYQAKLREMVLAAISYPTWGRAEAPMGNNSDLAAGHLTRGVAVAYDWHRGIFSEEERKKIREVIAERAGCLLRGLYGKAYWARGYEENHNQVAVAGLAFCGVAFYDEIPEAPEWLAAARLDYEKVFAALPGDGSSVEGVSYWGYGMASILQYVEGTRPVIDTAKFYGTAFLRNAAAFRMMAATPGLAGVLPWGDTVPRGWSTPHYILYRLAAQYDDAGSAWFADHLPEPAGGTDERTLNMLWARNAPAAGAAPEALDGWLRVNDMVNSRTGWSAEDYLLSIKAGFTNRNHSHLDAGALALAFGEEWVLAAPGYGATPGQGAYWDRKGGKRWTFFVNATESHSTLLVNGRNQRHDAGARAAVTEFFSAPSWMVTDLDLTGAYDGVKAVTREVLHRRGDYILVFDVVEAKEPATVEWLAQFRTKPATAENQTLRVTGTAGGLRLRMVAPAEDFSPRPPASPHVDVKGDYFSYAVKVTGTRAAFAALLQPVKAAAPAPALRVEAASPARLTITGRDWIDVVARSDKVSRLILPLDDGAQAGATAMLAAARRKGADLESLLAVRATALTAPGFAFSSSSACDLSVEKTDKAWLVTASRDVTGEVTGDDGRNVQVTVRTGREP